MPEPGRLSEPDGTIGPMTPEPIHSMADLVVAASLLGAEEVPGLSRPEKELLNAVPASSDLDVEALRAAVLSGRDPLGDAFCRLRTADERRPQGQTFTPAPIVAAMVDWAATRPEPVRVVDPGVGSARYLLAAGRRFAGATLLGADLDPVAALLARANLAAAGLADRSRIELVDYRELRPEPAEGPTLYLGNPPYVRHHGIPRAWKQWLTETAAAAGLRASQLAGLHVHFFLATLRHARPGDLGCLVTSAEWLDVNYGSLVRELLTGDLGGRSVHVVDPTAMPFADATTTAAITCFEVGRPVTSMRLQAARSLDDLGDLTHGRRIARERLVAASRWTPLMSPRRRLPEGYVELGELARVHRGTVTGANRVWVTDRADQTAAALPEAVLRPCVTRAKELFDAGTELAATDGLRVVIDLPADLDELGPDDRLAVERFLRRRHVRATRDGYIASARRAWWSVGLREPAPVLATYMARRPPAFVLNPARAGHINIAHGIYPREPLEATAIRALADHLRVSVSLGQGRTYAGGLTKFEPREMERLPVPGPALLTGGS